MELMSFGKSSGGVYRGQNGNDDLAMTCVNLSSVFDSSQFFDVAVDTFENMGVEYAKEIERVFLNVNRSDNERSMYDYGKLREMNNVGGHDTPQNRNVSPNVFDSQSLEQFEKIKRHFFKS